MLTKKEINGLSYIRFRALKETLYSKEGYIMEAKRYDWGGKYSGATWTMLASDGKWYPMWPSFLANIIGEVLEYETLDD